MEPIVIIGAGWSGLACAITLVHQGHNITLLEASPNPGGRARSVQFANTYIDNGQHLLIGAYQEIFKLQALLGLNTDTLYDIKPFSWNIYQKTDLAMRLTIPKLPLPFKINLFIALFKAAGISIKEKYNLVHIFNTWQRRNFHLATEDISVLSMLQQLRQPARIIDLFWRPLGLAVMSTPIENSSAQIFLTVLKHVFNDNQQHSDFYFPTQDLSQLLPTPAVKFIQQHHNPCHFSTRINKLIIQDNKITGVASRNNTWHGKKFILATPPWETARLLESINIDSNLNQFRYQPITTVYLQFKHQVTLPYPMIAFADSPINWLFQRSTQDKHILSAVIIGNLRAENLSKQQLFEQVVMQLPAYLKNNPVLDYKVIREKKAAFSCDINIQAMRARIDTDIKNLALCGDYINNPFPATLEGAVISGIAASKS